MSMCELTGLFLWDGLIGQLLGGLKMKGAPKEQAAFNQSVSKSTFVTVILASICCKCKCALPTRNTFNKQSKTAAIIIIVTNLKCTEGAHTKLNSA